MAAALSLLDFTPESYDATHRPMMETNTEKKRQEAKCDPAPGSLALRKPGAALPSAAGNVQPAQPAAAAGMLALPPPAPRQRVSGGSGQGAGALVGVLLGPAGGTAGAAGIVQGLTLPPMATRIRK
jgi:hypothetical protein